MTEPVSHAVLFGEGPLAGLNDGTWQIGRGGLFGRTPRANSMFQPASRLHGLSTEPGLEVYRFTPDLPSDSYLLTRQRRTLMGWQAVR